MYCLKNSNSIYLGKKKIKKLKDEDKLLQETKKFFLTNLWLIFWIYSLHVVLIRTLSQ